MEHLINLPIHFGKLQIKILKKNYVVEFSQPTKPIFHQSTMSYRTWDMGSWSTCSRTLAQKSFAIILFLYESPMRSVIAFFLSNFFFLQRVTIFLRGDIFHCKPRKYSISYFKINHEFSNRKILRSLSVKSYLIVKYF